MCGVNPAFPTVSWRVCGCVCVLYWVRRTLPYLSSYEERRHSTRSEPSSHLPSVAPLPSTNLHHRRDMYTAKAHRRVLYYMYACYNNAESSRPQSAPSNPCCCRCCPKRRSRPRKLTVTLTLTYPHEFAAKLADTGEAPQDEHSGMRKGARADDGAHARQHACIPRRGPNELGEWV